MKNGFFLRAVACLLLLVILCTSVACGDGGTPNTNQPPEDKTPEELEEESFKQLMYYLTNIAYYPLPEDLETDGLSRVELVKATGDRYAQYFTAEEYAAYTSDLGGNLVGIGVSITEYNQENIYGIHVLSVFPDSPAEQAGMQARDVIIGVDGQSVSDLGYAEALGAVAGDKGSTVTLACLRDGSPITFEVTRNTCTKQTVHSRVITVGAFDIGYVYITEFDAVTSLQFINAVEALEAQGVDRLLFDVRGNPGGYLHTVCEMLAFALPDGDICSVDYGYENYADYTVSSADGALVGIGSNTMADGRPLPVSHSLENIPIGILIDKSTASAAELFTSAFRDYAAAGKLDVTLFGANTYGKGCMQTSFALANGDHLKLTVALYNPPSGVNYHGVGIAPTDGCVVAASHESVVPRFLGGYDDIGSLDAALTLALNTLAQ